jgi:long-chain acyl-CoA synthetase
MTPEEIADLPQTLSELPFFSSGRYPTTELIGRSTVAGVIAAPGRELIDQVRDLSLGLSSLGMAPGDRVILLAESRVEWILSDLAILAAGAVTTPIYPTLSADQMAFIVRDSGAKLAIASTPAQLAKLRAANAALDVVLIDPGPNPAAHGPGVVSFAEVTERGHKQILGGWGVARTFHDTAKRVKPDDIATLIYTSGTTGEPKGVPLTHANILANVIGVHRTLDLFDTDIALSFLPLCHAFERVVSYVYLARGISMIFAESIDTVERDLKTVRPTVMTGVPRVFEKLHDKILARGADRRGFERRLFDVSIRTALERGEVLSAGKPLSLSCRLRSRLAERVVFTKVREAVGGRLRYAVSGGAALPVEIGRFFYGIGIPLLEGYGLTETSPCCA